MSFSIRRISFKPPKAALQIPRASRYWGSKARQLSPVTTADNPADLVGILCFLILPLEDTYPFPFDGYKFNCKVICLELIVSLSSGVSANSHAIIAV